MWQKKQALVRLQNARHLIKACSFCSSVSWVFPGWRHIYFIVDATYPRNITATVEGYAITVTWDSPHAELPPTAFYNVYFTSDAQSAEMRLPSSATNAKYYPTSWSVYRIQISTTVGNEEGEMSPAVVVNTRDYFCELINTNDYVYISWKYETNYAGDTFYNADNIPKTHKV